MKHLSFNFKALSVLTFCLLYLIGLHAVPRIASEPEPKSANQITMLFAYTKRAAIEVGDGPKTILELVEEGVKNTNEALNNNTIGYQIEIIPQFVEVEYMQEHDNETMENLMDELKKVDGKFNKVHQFRKQLKADFVCLIYSGKGGGMAELNGSLMVASIGSFGGNYVYSHEVGHLLGGTHEVGMRFDFGNRFNRYRTITGTGGAAIPYYSENKTATFNVVAINGEDKQVTEKIGDSNHDNAVIMRKNAPSKPSLGDNLESVASSSAALAARLVNPKTEPMPKGAKPLFTSNFTVTRKGKSVDAKFTYEATQRFVEKKRDEGIRVKIQAFTADGEKDPFNGSTRQGFNIGKDEIGRVFDGHSTYKDKEMKPGSYVELQYVTVNDDGSTNLIEVLERVYITDNGTKKDDSLASASAGSKNVSKTPPTKKTRPKNNPSKSGNTQGKKVFTKTITKGENDIELNPSRGNYKNSTDLELVNDYDDNQKVGLRFTDIQIPRGAKITKAYIQFTADEATSGTTNLTISMDPSPKANDRIFDTDFKYDANTKVSTSAESVKWNNVPAWNKRGEAGAAQRTPDLSNMIKAFMAKGFTNGQSMTFWIAGSGTRTAGAAENDHGPTLHIEYEGSNANRGNTYKPKATPYTIEIMSGNGQTYTGGGMPSPMVIKIKNNATNQYVDNLYQEGLKVEAITNKRGGKYDGTFNNLNDACKNGDKTCFGGYYYVPSNRGLTPYQLVVRIRILKEGKEVGATIFKQNIKN